MKKKELVQLSVWVRPELATAIKAAAQAEHRSVSQFIQLVMVDRVKEAA